MKYCCTNDQRMGTCYFEFQKGKFADKHWLDNSLCLSADIFDGLDLYQVFVEAVHEFNYYGVTELNIEKWEQVKRMADKIGGEVQAVIAEIDLWASSVLPNRGVITVLGI